MLSAETIPTTTKDQSCHTEATLVNVASDPTRPPSSLPASYRFFSPLVIGSDVERARADQARRLASELGRAA